MGIFRRSGARSRCVLVPVGCQEKRPYRFIPLHLILQDSRFRTWRRLLDFDTSPSACATSHCAVHSTPHHDLGLKSPGHPVRSVPSPPTRRVLASFCLIPLYDTQSFLSVHGITGHCGVASLPGALMSEWISPLRWRCRKYVWDGAGTTRDIAWNGVVFVAGSSTG